MKTSPAVRHSNRRSSQMSAVTALGQARPTGAGCWAGVPVVPVVFPSLPPPPQPIKEAAESATRARPNRSRIFAREKYIKNPKQMAILAIRRPIQAVDQAQAITNRRSRRSLRPVPQTPPGQSMAAQHIPKPLRRQDSRHKPPRNPTSTDAAELGAKAPRCIVSAQLFSETCHEHRSCDAASALENQRLTAHFPS